MNYLDVKIVFESHYSKNPIDIIFQSKTITLSEGKNIFDYRITDINQIEEIEFMGFIPSDHAQNVKVRILHKKQTLDTSSLSSFKMYNNLYVKNESLDNYDNIHFNGILKLSFFKEWFECNILQGSNLFKQDDTIFINWQENYKKTIINQSDIFCIGDSFTLGQGVPKNKNWPSLLSREIDQPLNNLGISGLSIDGCYHNCKFVLKKFKSTKKIIFLLPTRYRKLCEFNFMGLNGYLTVTMSNEYNFLPDELYEKIEHYKKNEITNETIVKSNWTSNCKNIAKLCEAKNVECFISTWDLEMYDHIPDSVKLPKFPNLDRFLERADDGLHPHEKHYKFFVEQITPYINRQKNKKML